jgi:hypothetical protein
MGLKNWVWGQPLVTKRIPSKELMARWAVVQCDTVRSLLTGLNCRSLPLRAMWGRLEDTITTLSPAGAGSYWIPAIGNDF